MTILNKYIWSLWINCVGTNSRNYCCKGQVHTQYVFKNFNSFCFTGRKKKNPIFWVHVSAIFASFLYWTCPHLNAELNISVEKAIHLSLTTLKGKALITRLRHRCRKVLNKTCWQRSQFLNPFLKSTNEFKMTSVYSGIKRLFDSPNCF